MRERAVLTLSGAGTALTARRGACAATALAAIILALTWTAARAEGAASGGCIGGGRTLNCVVRWGDPTNPYIKTVPPAADDAERAHAAERERKWERRCQPTIQQDRFGVARYQYAAPGCEFGVIE